MRFSATRVLWRPTGSKKERDSIVAHIGLLEEENNLLEDEIDLLKNDKRYVEMVARKDLGMIGKDEIIYMLGD